MAKPFIATVIDTTGALVCTMPVPRFEGDKLPKGYLNKWVYPPLARRTPIMEVEHKKVRKGIYDITVYLKGQEPKKYRLTLRG